MGQESHDHSPAVGYARGVAGGLIAGLPLLYTMEVWWLGETATPLHVLVMLVFATVPVGILVLTAGFRKDSDVSIGDVVIDTSTALLLGIVTCAVVLLTLQRLTIDTSLLAAIESAENRASPVMARRSTNSMSAIVMPRICAFVRRSHAALGSPCTWKSAPLSETYRP